MTAPTHPELDALEAQCSRCKCFTCNQKVGLIQRIRQQDEEIARVTRERDADHWVCFHCGFDTRDPLEAQAHFGERDDAEEFTPLCKWWSKLTTEERAQEIQDLQKQVTSLQDENALCCTRIDSLEYQLNGQRSEIQSFKPFRQCNTIQQVFNVYDSMEGRALLAEEQRDSLRTENDRLKAENAARWQPIETAPKDGTEILAYPCFSNPGAFQVSWSQSKRGGWKHWTALVPLSPTLWMPMPAPPVLAPAAPERQS